MPEWVKAASLRREVHDDVFEVLIELERRRWRIRRQGHKFYVYCPCGAGGSSIRVDGTPRNPVRHAHRVLREASHCPDRHELDG